MKIKSISCENFRSFKDEIYLDNIKPVSVFVGANNAGKSNTLEILSFLRTLSNREWSKPYSDLAFDNNDKFNIEVDLELSDDEIQKIIHQIPTPNSLEGQLRYPSRKKIFQFLKYEAEIGEKRCLNETLSLSDINGRFVKILYYLFTPKKSLVESTRVNIEKHFHSNSGSVEDFSQLQLEGGTNSADESLGIFQPDDLTRNTVQRSIVVMLRNYFQKIRIFEAHRKANPAFVGEKKWKLMESGENLIEVMSTILGKDQTKYSEIIEEYNKIVGSPLKVNVPPSKDGKYHTIKLDEKGLSNQTDFQNISTGLHEALILVLAIEQAESGETICIEEPEIHLHSSAQKKLFNLICKHADKNQIFITTHSPIFTAINDDVNTYLITRSDVGSQVTLFENEKELKFIKKQLGIRNSDIYGNDYVVFIEGKSEEYAFPIISLQLGNDDVGVGAGKKIRLINLEGNGIIPKLEQFLEYLINSDVEAFLIADGDKNVHSSVEEYIKKGLLNEKNVIVWEKEFEDTFENSKIINAMKKLSENKGFQFTLTEQELEKERNDGGKVADVLQKHLYEHSQHDLNKPDLAVQLANDIIVERSSKAERKETTFETEVEKILKTIELLDNKK